jgi:hypothetical protein
MAEKFETFPFILVVAAAVLADIINAPAATDLKSH